MRFLGALVGFLVGYFTGEAFFLQFGEEEIFFGWPAGLLGCLVGYYFGGLWGKKKKTD